MHKLSAGLETRPACESWGHAGDFVCEIGTEWKAWLTGSAPMASISLMSLANPEWIKLPYWSWAILIFVGGLIAATFRVYRDLRQRHDSLCDRLARAQMSGPFLLVPFEKNGGDKKHDL